MYKCKNLTDKNVQKMLGSVKYHDVLTYNLRTQEMSSSFYNGYSAGVGRLFMSQLELACKNLESWERHYALRPVVLAVKTVSPMNLRHFGDYVIAPHDFDGPVVLGNIIFFDKISKEYVCSPNKWVYVNTRSSLSAVSGNAMYDFVSKLVPHKSAVLQRLVNRHR